MNWTLLESDQQIQNVIDESLHQPILIFKHSTRCSISKATLARLERNWKNEELPANKIYFLDLLSYRDISNKIAASLEVEHESPQLIVMHLGKAVYVKSHFDIDYASVKNALHALTQKVA
jgi:bacillithiol system protein YtxJ